MSRSAPSHRSSFASACRRALAASAAATAVSALALALALAGCQRPLGASSGESLAATIQAAIARELASPMSGQDTPPERVTTRSESRVVEELAPRRAELDRLTPGLGDPPPPMELGPDLDGQPQQRIAVSLDQAVGLAVQRNLDVQRSRVGPGIRAEEVIEAEAVFDWLLFGRAEYSEIDEPQTVPVLGGIPLGTPATRSDTWRFETGVSRRFAGGGIATISTDLTRFRNDTAGIAFSPDPAYTSALRLGVTQPLLRGFGRDTNLAVIRLARNQQRRSVHDVQIALLRVADDTEAAYWDLAQAWANLGVAEWLVGVGVEVRDVLGRRRDFDVSLAEYADAVARVEQRQADVVRARRAVRAASDRLKQLMNDDDMRLASETVLHPSDALLDQPIAYSLREALLMAVRERPEIAQAALAIEDADVRIAVADNNRLPVLDLSAQASLLGLDDSADESYSELTDARFIDYVVGLLFEYPLGNRAAEAGFRRARLERTAATLGYRQAVQNVVLEVKSALRDVLTNYELIAATRAFRIAQAENLRSLLVEEETLAGLTPEFLNLKFQRQETLASARRQEIDAIASFDRAVAALYRAMGIGLTMKNIRVEEEQNNEGGN